MSKNEIIKEAIRNSKNTKHHLWSKMLCVFLQRNARGGIDSAPDVMTAKKQCMTDKKMIAFKLYVFMSSCWIDLFGYKKSINCKCSHYKNNKFLISACLMMLWFMPLCKINVGNASFWQSILNWWRTDFP